LVSWNRIPCADVFSISTSLADPLRHFTSSFFFPRKIYNDTPTRSSSNNHNHNLYLPFLDLDDLSSFSGNSSRLLNQRPRHRTPRRDKGRDFFSTRYRERPRTNACQTGASSPALRGLARPPPLLSSERWGMGAPRFSKPFGDIRA
jgi:hypothetical protein